MLPPYLLGKSWSLSSVSVETFSASAPASFSASFSSVSSTGSTGSRRCSKFFVSDSVVCAALSAVSDCSVTVSVWADVSSEVAASV